MSNEGEQKLRKEVAKFRHDYEELRLEIEALLLQDEKKIRSRIIGTFTAAGSMVETLLLWIIKKEGREKQLSNLEGKQQGLFEYKRIIQDLVPKQQNIHIGTIAQWRNLVAHANDIDKVDIHELAAVKSALKAFVSWFFEDYLKKEFLNDAKNIVPNEIAENKEDLLKKTAEIKPSFFRKPIIKRKALARILTFIFICVALIYFGHSFYEDQPKPKSLTKAVKVKKTMSREQAYEFLIKYFNSVNDNSCNAHKFFADKIYHFYAQDSINPTDVDIIRQTNVDYTDNKHEIDKQSLFLYELRGVVTYWRFWNDYSCYRPSKHRIQKGKVQMEFGINNENKIISIKEIIVLKPKYTRKKSH